MNYIYALLDPRNDQVRYVGKANDVKRRLQGHLCPGNLAEKKHTSRWLALLRKLELKPIQIILEEVPENGDWQEAERLWIATLREAGYDLTNFTDGGEGGATARGRQLGRTQSTLVRIKSSLRHRGMKMPPHVHNEKACKKRGLAIKAHWDEVREQGGKKKGPVHTEESRQKLRDSHNPKSNLNLRPPKKGSKSPKRIFTDDEVRDIRVRFLSGETQINLAKVYNTAQGTISSIVLCKTYQDVVQNL